MRPNETMPNTVQPDEEPSFNPMFGFDQSIDFKDQSYDIGKLAQQDVQRQLGEILGPTDAELKEKFERMLSSTTPEELKDVGISRIDNFLVTPESVAAVRQDPAKKLALFGKLKQVEQPTTVAEFQVPVPFSGPKYEQIKLPQILRNLPEEVAGPVIAAVKNRQNVAQLFSETESPLNYMGQQIILDSFKTGDLVEASRQSLANIPGDFARLPTLVAMITNAGIASVDAYESEDESNGMDTDYSERFSESFSEGMQTYGNNPIVRGYEGLLNKSEILESATQTFNKWYKEKFIAKHGAELWTAAHQRETYELVNPGDANYDEAIAKMEGGVGKPYVNQVFDEDGNPVLEDMPLSSQLVSDLIDTAYNELSGSEKAVVFFGTQLPFTLGLTGMSVRRGNQMARQVSQARKSDPTKYATLDDWSVWKAIGEETKASGGKLLKDRFVSFVLGVSTAGMYGFKGKGASRRGGQMNQHLQTLEKFEGEIKTNENLLEAAQRVLKSDRFTMAEKNRARKQIPELKDDIALNKANFSRYKRRAGGSSGVFKNFNNPYTRSLIADDLIISAAVGYVPQVMDWTGAGFDQGTVETITMFTAPIIAPVVFRTGVFVAGASAKKVGVTGVVKNVAETFQNAAFIPHVTASMIARGDEAELRDVMDKAGVAVTDDNVEAFQTMSEVYKSMKPEYQIRMTESLRKYNNVLQNMETRMRGFVKKDGTALLSEDEIATNMDTLHLSLAHATGIAPLIAIQARSGRQLSAEDLRDAGKFDDLMNSLAAEEANYKGMNTLMEVLQKSLLQEGGIDMNTNTQLQNMLVELQNVTSNGLEKLNVKKQEADQLVKSYMNELGEVDEETLTRIVNFRSILSGADIRDPIAMQKLTLDTAVEILDNGRLKAVALNRFRDTVENSEFFKNANGIADKIFDITDGVRRREVSSGYNDVAVYAAENGISVDLSPLATKLMNLTDDYKGKPLEYMFTQAATFFNGSGPGGRAKRAFESSADRGLTATFGDEKNEVIAAVAKADPSVLNDTSFVNARVAAFLMEQAAEGKKSQVNYFMATVEETEHVYRAFRDHQAKAKDQTVVEIDSSFKELTDDAYEAADESGQLIKLARGARELHETLIGEPTDPKRYAGQVDRGRARKNVKTSLKAEGRHYYPIPTDRPLQPFLNIAELARKAVETVDDVDRQLIIKQISEEKDRIMFWYGAGKMNDGDVERFGFDLGDRKQRVVADTMKSLLQAVIGKEVADDALKTLNALTDTTALLSGAKNPRELALARLKKGEGYNFTRSQRIAEVENALVVFTRNGPDGEVTPTNLTLTDVRDWSVPLDELLKSDADTIAVYNSTRSKLNNNESSIRQAAQQEVDKYAQTLKIMSEYTGITNDPEAFFKVVFENADYSSINRHVKRFVDQGMNETEVRKTMAYMYVRGLEIKSGKKTELVAGEPAQVVGDVTTLVNYVETPRYAETMKAVLGEEHYNIMKDISEWANFSAGNGMGFRANQNLQGMSVESVFSRVFNLARGMVSPIYVASEISVRTLMQRNQSLISFALNDRVAARIMAKIMTKPKTVSRKDLELFTLRINNYIAEDLVRRGGEVPALEAMFGPELGKGQTEIVEDSFQQERQEIQDVATENSQAEAN